MMTNFLFSNQIPSLTRMNELCGQEGSFKVPSAASLEGIPVVDRVFWCQSNAVYQIPTQELIQYLQDKIAGRPAIEICAGHGVIGRALGIPRTDSYVQVEQHKAYYESLGCPVTRPPADVRKMEALQAVRKLKPRVVIACWATQKWRVGDLQGSVTGVDEEELLQHVDMYIHIGNHKVHGQKRILAKPHAEEQYPWLHSRGFDASQNVIYIWGK